MRCFRKVWSVTDETRQRIHRARAPAVPRRQLHPRRRGRAARPRGVAHPGGRAGVPGGAGADHVHRGALRRAGARRGHPPREPRQRGPGGGVRGAALGGGGGGVTAPAKTATSFGPHVLRLPDPDATIAEIAEGMRRAARGFRRRGGVVGLSGGVDSSVVAALAARAFGPDNVLGVMMPEADSSEDTLALSRLAAEAAGITTVLENITPILDGAGAYRRRDEAIRRVVPRYGPGWKVKLVLPSVIESESYRIFSLVARSPDGEEVKARLPLEAYLQVVAATNFKQRTRKMV